MSVFKPNNLSPNMEEVVVERIDDYELPTALDNLEYEFINGNILHPDGNEENRGSIPFTFIVHTKMSYVRSYCLTILDKNATQDTEEKYTLGKFYGGFEDPYKDGDEGVIYITYKEFLDKGIKMIPGNEYIWKLRLYEDPIPYTFYQKYDYFYIHNSPMIQKDKNTGEYVYNKDNIIDDILEEKENVALDLFKRKKKKIQQKDEDGNLIYDSKGNPIYEKYENGDYKYEKNENGDYEYEVGLDGKYIYESDNFDTNILKEKYGIILKKNIYEIPQTITDILPDDFDMGSKTYAQLTYRDIDYSKISEDTPYIEFSNLYNLKEDNIGNSMGKFGNISIFTGPLEILLIPFYDNNFTRVRDLGTTEEEVESLHTRHNLNFSGFNKFWLVRKPDNLFDEEYSKTTDENGNDHYKTFIAYAYITGPKSIIDDTYVGGGFLSGSTKGVMWIDNKKYPIKEDQYFGYDAHSDYMYDPNYNGNEPLLNVNNSDFIPFGVNPSAVDKTVDLQINNLNTTYKYQNNIPKTFGSCIGWNLPEIICKYLNKNKNVSSTDLIPGLGITWNELVQTSITNDEEEESESEESINNLWQDDFQVYAAILDIFYNTEVVEKIYINKDDIPDFEKWKKYLADGNMWVKFKIKSGEGAMFPPQGEAPNLTPDQNNIFIENRYENQEFKICSSGTDQNGFYIAINPQDGILYSFLSPVKYLFSMAQITLQHSLNSPQTSTLAIIDILDKKNDIFNKIFDTENASGNNKIYSLKNDYVQPFESCIFIYKQRQKIVQIDEGLGKNNLTRVILDDSMNINKFLYGDRENQENNYRTRCCTNLLSDNFTQSTVYIPPNQGKIEPGKSYIYLYKNSDDRISESYIKSYFEKKYPENYNETVQSIVESNKSITMPKTLKTYLYSNSNLLNALKPEYYLGIFNMEPIIKYVSSNIAYDSGTNKLTDNYLNREFEFKYPVPDSLKSIAAEYFNNTDKKGMIKFRLIIASRLLSYGWTVIDRDQSDSGNNDIKEAISYNSGYIKIDWDKLKGQKVDTNGKGTQNRTLEESLKGGLLLHTSIETLKDLYYIHFQWTIENQKMISEQNLLNWTPFNYNMQKITNYDQETGQIQTAGNFPRVPDISYKYQIFNLETSSLENSSSTVSLNYTDYYSPGIEGVLGDPINKNYENLATNFSPWDLYSLGLPYRNIKGISNENLNNCKFFIQPSVIQKDPYKYTRFDLYNQQDQVNIFGGTDTFNGKDIATDKTYDYYKDFIIDELTDDQWLINCRYDSGDWTNNLKNNINEYISMNPMDQLSRPQTNYKIYNNFTDSIPGGYFYVRNNKKIFINFKDKQGYEEDVIFDNDFYSEIINEIHFNSLNISADIFDEDYLITDILNLSKIKSYKYILYDYFDNIIIETEDKYDDKFNLDIDWIENNKENEYYKLELICMDEFNYKFIKKINIKIVGYDLIETADQINFNLTADCKKHRVSISQMMEILLNSYTQGDYYYIYKKQDDNVIGHKIIQGEYYDEYYFDNEKEIFDYNIKSNKKFSYVIMKRYSDENNNPISIIYRFEGIAKWNNWSIINLEYDFDLKKYTVLNDNQFYFKNNLETDQMPDNILVNQYTTNDKYGRIDYTNSVYESGYFSCLLGDMFEIKKIENITNMYKKNNDNEWENINIILNKTYYQYVETMDKLKDWDNFIFDKKIKLLKDPKGNLWIVSMISDSSYDIDQRSGQYPTTIEFSWQEIMNNNLQIIGIFDKIQEAN